MGGISLAGLYQDSWNSSARLQKVKFSVSPSAVTSTREHSHATSKSGYNPLPILTPLPNPARHLYKWANKTRMCHVCFPLDHRVFRWAWKMAPRGQRDAREPEVTQEAFPRGRLFETSAGWFWVSKIFLFASLQVYFSVFSRIVCLYLTTEVKLPSTVDAQG